MYWTKSRKNISWAKKSLEDPFQARDHLGVCSHFVNHKRRDRRELENYTPNYVWIRGLKAMIRVL
jgi:hypothetical protein